MTAGLTAAPAPSALRAEIDAAVGAIRAQGDAAPEVALSTRSLVDASLVQDAAEARR